MSKTYTITNPYKAVDWAAWKPYKTALHVHTTYSDAKRTLVDTVESYYALDYDILAITDHGVLGTQWNKKPKVVPVLGYNDYMGKTAHLTDERYRQMITGSDRGNRPMLNVTQGIELNCLTLRKNHVNGFFCDYGQAQLGKENDFETPVRGNAEAGGLTFLNHLGDWTGGNRNASVNRKPEIVQFFSDIFIRHPSCVGMEIVNRNDNTTKNDRLLWDNILQVVLPKGRSVFAFASDDAHHETDCGFTFNIFMLPELSQKALRTGMETGAFFACSRRAKAELGDEFSADFHAPYPKVSAVLVDEASGTITVTGSNYDKIEWVSDGKVIAAGETLFLHEHEEEITCYVRFQMRSAGGMCFSQPFIIDDGSLLKRNGTVYVPPVVSLKDRAVTGLKNTRLYVAYKLLKK